MLGIGVRADPTDVREPPNRVDRRPLPFIGSRRGRPPAGRGGHRLELCSTPSSRHRLRDAGAAGLGQTPRRSMRWPPRACRDARSRRRSEFRRRRYGGSYGRVARAPRRMVGYPSIGARIHAEPSPAIYAVPRIRWQFARRTSLCQKSPQRSRVHPPNAQRCPVQLLSRCHQGALPHRAAADGASAESHRTGHQLYPQADRRRSSAKSRLVAMR